MFHHYHRIVPAVALTLALAAAPPASARPELNPVRNAVQSSAPASSTASVCSEVCSGGGYTAAKSTMPSSGYSGPRSEVLDGGGYGNGTAPATVVRVGAPSNSFDWGDAGIGAGGAVAIMLLAIGGAFGVGSAHRRTTRSTA